MKSILLLFALASPAKQDEKPPAPAPAGADRPSLLKALCAGNPLRIARGWQMRRRHFFTLFFSLHQDSQKVSA